MIASAVRITATVSLSLLSIGCGGGDDDRDGKRSGRGGGEWGGRQDEEAAVPVKTAAAMRGDISSYIQTHARLEAERWVGVVARTQGMVERLLVEEGDRVSEGDVLVRLDKVELSLRVQQAEVVLEQARATHQRRKTLFERQLVSEEEYEGAKNQLANAEVSLTEQRLNLAYADIKAPIAGVVMQRQIELGDLVRQNDEVFVVADLDPLLARIRVPEKRMGQVRSGQRATITIDAGQDETFNAQVRMINPGVDPQSGTVKVTLEVPSQGRQLKPGMFATVRLITELHRGALIIPKKALVLETDDDDVFVINGDKAIRTPIQIGFTDGDRVEVVSGLNDGDLVITVGQDGLKDGAAVRAAGTGLPEVEEVVKKVEAGDFGSVGRRGMWGGEKGSVPDSASVVARMMERRGLSEAEAIERWQKIKKRMAARAVDNPDTR